MNGMQRLVAAINGQRADRVPVFCNLLDQGARELGMSLREYYASGEHVAEAQLRMRERYGYDNVWSLFYVGKEAELFGCKDILFAEDGPPNVGDYLVKTWDDVDRLVVPDDLAGHPAFEGPARCLARLRREVGGTYPICAYITSTMTLPALLTGMDRWMELLLMGPADVRDRLLERCHQFFAREVAAYREAGADLLIYSNPFGSTDTVPLSYFRQRALPWIVRDIRAIGSDGVVYYCGMSRFNKVLDEVIEQTGLGAYYISPLDDLAESKRIVAGRGLTCGVINDARMVDWQPDEVVAEVRRLFAAGMPGGRFLFGTGVMPLGIPDDNIRAMLETAYECGTSVEVSA